MNNSTMYKGGRGMDTSAKDCLVLFDTSVEGKLACGWESGVSHS